jgi:hypothetical protein
VKFGLIIVIIEERLIFRKLVILFR